MKTTTFALTLLLTSNFASASTFSCSDESSQLNFYSTKTRITINPPNAESYSDVYNDLAVVFAKKRSLQITDDHQSVNLSTEFNPQSRQYEGNLVLMTSRENFDLQVRCTQIN